MICRQTEENAKGTLVRWECEKDGTAQGRIELFSCAVYIEGERVECAWLTMDAKDSQAEKALLNTAVQYAAQRQIPLCMCVGKHSEILKSEGFSARERRMAAVKIDPSWEDARFSLRLAEEKDTAWLRGLYSLYAGVFDAAFVRDSEEYWKESVLPKLENLSVLEKDGQIVAYMSYETNDDCLVIREFSAHPDYHVLLCAAALAAQDADEAIVPLPILGGNGQSVSEEKAFCAEEKLFFRVNRPFLFKNGRVRPDEISKDFMHNVVCWVADTSR